MTKELKNRERRLRYKANQKGLFIKKTKWLESWNCHGYKTAIGYCIGSRESGCIIAGFKDWFTKMMTLEEAEKYVAEY